MKPQDIELAKELTDKLQKFHKDILPLPGIVLARNLKCFVAQIIDSIRRIQYIAVIKNKDFSAAVIDPSNALYDPIKASIYYYNQGEIDEAFWQVFLSVYFGKNRRTGWGLLKGVYSGKRENWTWDNIISDFESFRRWLHLNQKTLKLSGGFGNHRKYQSLDAYSPTGTGVAIGSYIEWVGEDRNHELIYTNTVTEIGRDSKKIFHFLYQSMSRIVSFGRTARFDYLTMIGKLELMKIVPDSAYFELSTGPKRGAKLLIGGAINSNISNSRITEILTLLDSSLNLYFGMQVLEDSLCNWQKNPGNYQRFI